MAENREERGGAVGKKRASRTAVTSDKMKRDPSRSSSRSSRESADASRNDGGDTISMEEREEMLRDEYLQNALPNPPKKPGTHYFYASLNNQYTPVSWYLKLGYRPVRVDEMPGFADATRRIDNGEYAGCVGVNEMLLLKISEEGYQQIMRKIHHERAGEELGRIRQSVDSVKDAVGEDKEGSQLVSEEGDGFKEIERRARGMKRPRIFQ